MRATPVISGKREISIDIFNRYFDHEKLGSIVLRRSNGQGSLLIALDDQGLRYWGMRVSLKNAVEDLGKGQKLSYLAVVGPDRSLFAGTGDLPEGPDDGGNVLEEILRGNTPVANRKITAKGKKLLEVLAPIRLDSVVVGALRVGLEREQADQLLDKNRSLMIISMVFIMLIGLLSMWFLYQNQNRHLARIEEMRKELQKSERLSSLGQLAAGVAHEIRNPLNAISMASQRLQREFPPEDREKREEFGRITSIVRDEVRRLNGIIEEFLAFSRSQCLELRNYPVEVVLQKLVRLVDEEARSRGIAIETRWGNHSTPLPMDVDKLQQAFLNIIKNAMESISGEGVITISLEPQGPDRIAIRVVDTGAGLTPEEMERIFNPEYTTKEKGLGLGLPIAHEIVRSHGGEIRVQSRVGSGTTFEILLPLGMKG
jgi:signal transduction histidine kinase